ncbi:MAG: endo-1,3-alpha-glucanase family glycosylhydrolase [Spirochaetota bacterium]
MNHIRIAVITFLAAAILFGAEDGLSAYWSFNEEKGTAAADSAGGFHGTTAGPVMWKSGKVGNAAIFNGVNTSVSAFPDIRFLSQGYEEKPFSICAWVKPDGEQSGTERVIVGKPGFHAGLMANTANGQNTFSFVIWTPKGGEGMLKVSTPPLAFDTWYHVSAVYEKRVLTIYINGKESASGRFENEMRKYPNMIAIGGIGKFTFKGMIDEVSLFSLALTEADIARIMAKTDIADVSSAPAPRVRKISFAKDRPELAAVLFTDKPVLAHYMTSINPSGEAKWLLDPAQYRPDGPTGSIGGAARYRVLSGYYYSNRSLEDIIEYEIRTAKRLGIDGFHFYYQSFESGAGGEVQAGINNDMIRTFFKVLDEKNIDFKLTLCLSHPNQPETSEQKIIAWSRRIRSLLKGTANSRHWLRAPDGRIIFLTWSTEGLADGVKNTADILRQPNVEENMKALAEAYESLADAMGIKAAFVYHMSASEHVRVASKGKDIGDVDAFYKRYVNAVFDYFPAATGFADMVFPEEDADWDYVISTAKKRGRFYGQAVLTDFYDSKVFSKKTKQMYHFERDIQKITPADVMTYYLPIPGATMFRTLLDRAVTNDVSFMSYVTWNDYPEGHHLAPEINHNFAYSILLQYYKNIWRKKPQTVTGDVAFAFYRKYPSTAVPSHFNIDIEVPYWHINNAVRDQLVPAQDIIDVAAILAAPAEVWVNGRKRMDAAAGLSSVQIPMEIGAVRVEIRRGGKTVVDLKPPEWITDKPYRTDRFNFGYSSRCEAMYKELFGEKPPFVSDEYAETDGVPNWKTRYTLKK